MARSGSSQVARQVHTLEVAGSNPASATILEVEMNVGKSKDLRDCFWEILVSIKNTRIFSDDQILTISPLKSDKSSDRPYCFFRVGNGIYFYLVSNKFFLIRSANDVLEDPDASRTEKMDSIEEITLEELFNLAPKNMGTKIAFHIDLFSELLK